MRLLCQISAMVLYFAFATAKPAGAESEPIGMGVSYGNLLTDWPFLEVAATDINCVAGEFGDSDILNQTKERGINEVKFIANVKSDQLASLFDGARQLAVANQVSFYGISNLKQNVSFRENQVYIETCGDMLALRKSAKK